MNEKSKKKVYGKLVGFVSIYTLTYSLNLYLLSLNLHPISITPVASMPTFDNGLTQFPGLTND